MSDLTTQLEEQRKKRLEFDKQLRDLYKGGKADADQLSELRDQALSDPTANLTEKEFDARTKQVGQTQGSIASLLKQELAKELMGAVGKNKTTNRDVLAGIYDKGFNLDLEEDQMDNFLGKKGVTLYESPEDQMIAQQKQTAKVNLLRGGGDLMGSSKAMQDPNYVLGSSSSLRQPARSISPESAKLRTASRRLARQGYKEEAGKMAAMAEIERLDEPRIRTQAQRNRMDIQDYETDLASLQNQKESGLFDRFLSRSKKNLF